MGDISSIVKQSSLITSVFLSEAVMSIDTEFGKGFAKANPELVGRFVETCCEIFDELNEANECASQPMGM